MGEIVNTSRVSAALPAPQTLPWSVARPIKTLWLFFRRQPLGALGSTIILLVVLTGIFGPLVAPYEPDDIGVAKKYAMPSWPGTLVGAILGLMSGYWGGKTDAIMQRFIDILMSFPLIILALTLLTALQRSLATVIVAIGVPFIPYGARVVRASAMVIKEIQYVEAARAIGCSDLRIIARHIAPSCVSLYLVLTTGFIGVAIITESALGFLGLSIPPPTPTLGGMLSEALALLMFAPHVAVAPGVFITLAVFAFNVLGDALRDILDPRLRGRG